MGKRCKVVGYKALLLLSIEVWVGAGAGAAEPA